MDDGSTDHPDDIVEATGDCRVRFYRLDRNRGRGFARQFALDIASGEYVTMLDADDWVYPTKFLQQIELLESEPDVAVVSTGMAVANWQGELVGVRRLTSHLPVLHASMTRLGAPPIAFAPSMLRTVLAKQTSFNRSLRISEDFDFLLRLLLGRRYALICEALYVYREQGSTTIDKVSPALEACCQIFGQYRDSYPLRSMALIVTSRLKQLVYHAAAMTGLWNHVIARRSRPPEATDLQRYSEIYGTLRRIAGEMNNERDAINSSPQTLRRKRTDP